MSDTAETTIKATITRTLIKDDGSTETVRVDVHGEAAIRDALQDIANEFAPETEKKTRITFVVEDENGTTIDSVDVFPSSPGCDDWECVSPKPKKYQSYEALLDSLDDLYEKYLAERQAEARRREECEGLLDFMAEEEDLPSLDECVCRRCKDTTFHWMKETPEEMRQHCSYIVEGENGERLRFDRLRPLWIARCSGCGLQRSRRDFVKDSENENLYVYDERRGEFSIYVPEGDAKMPWNNLRKLSEAEIEELPERIKTLRKVGADCREADALRQRILWERLNREPEITIQATINRELIKEDGSTEKVRTTVKGDGAIKSALRDIANEFVPDSEKQACVTFVAGCDYCSIIERIEVLHRYPDVDGTEHVSLIPGNYQNYKELLDGLDALFERYRGRLLPEAEKHMEALRQAWKAKHEKDCQQ